MTAKRTYRAAQKFVCSLPSCGMEFEAAPSDRIHERIYCCQSHASQDRERRFGHSSVTMECNTCGKPVTRPNSKIPGRNAYCIRECYYNRIRGLDD